MMSLALFALVAAVALRLFARTIHQDSRYFEVR